MTRRNTTAVAVDPAANTGPLFCGRDYSGATEASQAAGQAEVAALIGMGTFSPPAVHKPRGSVSKMTTHYNGLVAKALGAGLTHMTVAGRTYAIKPRNASFTGQTGYNMTAALEAALAS